ncbi:hypothetical protein [Spirosoma pulveris]
MKGIENSNKIALNLKIDNKSKLKWFGNTTTGLGALNRLVYLQQNNLMKFEKRNKFYFLSNINNLGEDATGDVKSLITPANTDDISDIGNNERTNKIIQLPSNPLIFKRDRSNFNDEKFVSINAIHNFSTKIKLKTLLFYDVNNNTFYKKIQETYSLKDLQQSNLEIYNINSFLVNKFGKVDLSINTFNNTTFELTSKFSVQPDNIVSNYKFNKIENNEELNNKTNLFDSKLTAIHKTKSNFVLIFTGKYISEKSPQHYSSNNLLFKDFIQQDSTNMTNQLSSNRMEFVGFEFQLKKRIKNSDLIEFNLSNKFRTDQLLSNFYFSDPLNSLSYNDNLLFENNGFGELKYTKNVKSLNFILGISMHKIYVNSVLKSNNKSYNYIYEYVLPVLGFNWAINQKNKIFVSHVSSRAVSKITDNFTNYIMTSSRSLNEGLGAPELLNTNTTFVNYQCGNWGDRFFLNSSVVFINEPDYISNNYTITANSMISKGLILHNKNNLNLSISADKYIKSISTNIKVEYLYQKSNYLNLINSQSIREIKSINNKFNFELRSVFDKLFNFHFGYSNVMSNIISNSINAYSNNTLFLDLLFSINDKINFSLQSERYFLGNSINSADKYNYFLDLKSNFVIKPNTINFSFNIKNIFNNIQYTTLSVSDYSTSLTQYRILPRYAFLKLEYRF